MPLWLGASLANCPDLDFLLVWFYHSRDWHRAFTHSLAFALLVGAAVFLLLGRQRLRAAAAYSLAYTSHCLLDYVTTKVGGGVELFWPVSTERYGLRLIGLSELPSRMPPLGVLKALLVELLGFAPLFLLVLHIRRQRAQRVRATEGTT